MVMISFIVCNHATRQHKAPETTVCPCNKVVHFVLFWLLIFQRLYQSLAMCAQTEQITVRLQSQQSTCQATIHHAMYLKKHIKNYTSQKWIV